MFNFPNAISFLRIPLAFGFFWADPVYRTLAIVLALITDGLDGYLARRFFQTTKLGTLLDPLADKFFVILAGTVLITEGHLNFSEVCMLVCRDFSIILFGFYLVISGRFSQYQFRSIWCGKVTTVLQFLVLLAIVWDVAIPSYAFGVFVALAILALGELYLGRKSVQHQGL